MKKIIIITLLSSIFAGSVTADGKIHITADIKDAYIYIDGKKKAMLADGSSTIKVSEGDHTIRVAKQTKEWNFEGTRKIFVGNETLTNVTIKINKKGVGFPLNGITSTLYYNSLNKTVGSAIKSIFSISLGGEIKFDKLTEETGNIVEEESDLMLFGSEDGSFSLQRFSSNKITLIGNKPWTYLLKLDPALIKGDKIERIDSIQTKEGLAFWIKTNKNKFAIVKIGSVVKNFSSSNISGSVELNWVKVD